MTHVTKFSSKSIPEIYSFYYGGKPNNFSKSLEEILEITSEQGETFDQLVINFIIDTERISIQEEKTPSSSMLTFIFMDNDIMYGYSIVKMVSVIDPDSQTIIGTKFDTLVESIHPSYQTLKILKTTRMNKTKSLLEWK